MRVIVAVAFKLGEVEMLKIILATALAASSVVAAPAAAQNGDGRYYQGGGYQGGGYQGRPQTIRCASQDYARQRCRVDTRGGVTLVQQESKSACVQGSTWGYDPDGIWVRNGCAGVFAVGRRGPGYGGGNGGGYGGGFPPAQVPGAGYGRVIACSSINYQPARCAVDVYNGARLVQDISGSCNRRNWGWDRGGVWVANGCRGRFEVF